MKVVKLIVPLLLLAVIPFAAIANEPVANNDSAVSKTGKSKTTVASTSREKILQISNRIDELVKAQLDSRNEDLNEPVTDEVFLRRAYLDIVGRVPTIKETKGFLGSNDKQKREELIDELLDSYGLC